MEKATAVRKYPPLFVCIHLPDTPLDPALIGIKRQILGRMACPARTLTGIYSPILIIPSQHDTLLVIGYHIMYLTL